jgi:anthranilate/para-aminobenzoate synthase component I
MTPVVQELDLDADVPALARRLPPAKGTVVLWCADGSGPSYLACRPIASAQGIDPEPTLGIGELISQPEGAWSFPRWIGILPYEAFRDQERRTQSSVPDRRAVPPHEHPLWLRYGAVLRVDPVPGRVTVLGENQAAVAQLVHEVQQSPRARGSVQLRRLDAATDDAHLRRVARARELILDGDLYLVNLARRFSFSVQGDDLDLFQRMAEHSRPAFGAYMNLGDTRVCGTSPELFLRLGSDRSLLTSPIKGTRPRSQQAQLDRLAAEQLSTDPKERAELAMVIDVERNDLGRVAQVGSVRVSAEPRVVPCGAVWHRIADVTAQLDARCERTALLRAMTPSGSVTGAPKIRAMEVIAELEAARRGLYTGALGYVAHDGGMTLSMSIRTLLLSPHEASYFAGGGIVVDSDARRELEETEWKAQQLLALCDPGG